MWFLGNLLRRAPVICTEIFEISPLSHDRIPDFYKKYLEGLSRTLNIYNGIIYLEADKLAVVRLLFFLFFIGILNGGTRNLECVCVYIYTACVNVCTGGFTPVGG